MKKSLFIILNIIALLFVIAYNLKAQHIELLQQNKPVSIRGLSVVDDKIAWISANKGYTAITLDGGKTWNWQQVKGFEKADFRDIEAFSDKEAVIMSSGTPALILKTIDGGNSWQLKYRNIDTTYFLDAMDFADTKHGYVLGDPIDGKFVLLETKNSGETWNTFNNPPHALKGEAAFAASGTCLRVSNKTLNIVTGGLVTRYLSLHLSQTIWNIKELPLAHGQPSKGAFSISGNSKVIVGGDYSKNKSIDSVACIFNNSIANSSILVKHGPSGYQSCTEHISNKIYLATGTPGTNISVDDGQTWAQIDSTSYNVCRKARHGKLVLLAGDGGKIAILRM